MSDGPALCPIWLTPVPYEHTEGDATIYNSPRAGGRYWITGSAHAVLEGCDETLRVLLTSWLVEKRKAGETCPKVYARDLDSIAGRNRLSIEARGLNLLVYIRRALADEADVFEYGNREKEMLAWAESTSPVQLINVLTHLEEKGYLEKLTGWPGAAYRITANGRAALEAPQRQKRKIGFRP